MPLNSGGSLSSRHSSDELHAMLGTVSVSELQAGQMTAGARCFVLQNPDVPTARLAEVWLLEPFPLGRFDIGSGGVGGTGPTLRGLATHEGLPLSCAAPLIAHVLSSQQPGAVEAVASLPGLCGWIAALGDIEAQFGVEVAAATMLMATRRHHGKLKLARPTLLQLNAAVLKARPAWETLAARFAASSLAEEVAFYLKAGASDVGIALGADTTPAGLMASGGAMALLAWPGEPALKVGESAISF